MTAPLVGTLAVAVGGAAGAVCRYAISQAARAYLPATLPFGTILVNTGGSLLLGVLVGLVRSTAGLPPLVFALVGTGFCGAFTTFSTFAAETLTSNLPTAVINILANNALALGAAALGIYLGRVVGS